MADEKTPTPKTGSGDAKAAAPPTSADVAKRVKRTVTSVKDGKETTAQVDVTADEVLAWKDYGSYVVVVTTDGQKLNSRDVAAAAAAATAAA